MKKKILAALSALTLGATMMAGTAMSASADTVDNIYPLALKNGSTTAVSMLQEAFTGGAAVYPVTGLTNTMTIPVKAFSIDMGFVSGNGYLTSVVLYIDDDGTSGYSSGDTVYSVGTVSPDLTTTSPATLTFTNLTAYEYDQLQKGIVSAYVSYDIEIISGVYTHSHREADFTLHNEFLTYPNNNVSLNGKPYAPVIDEDDE